MYEFEYARPTSLYEATALATNEDSLYLAGGMTLLPTCKHRLASPSMLIDLSAIPDLAGIADGDSTVTIGAMTRHYEVAASAAVRTRIPALAHLAGVIGDQQVRHRGTIGGSVANNDPAADYPAALLGLGAKVVTDQREILADDFFVGMFETALEPAELVTRILFPVPDFAIYLKIPSPASGYAVIGVMLSRRGDDVRVAVTGGGNGVFRVPSAEAALVSDWSPSAVKDIDIDIDMISEDPNIPVEYKQSLIRTLASRAVAATPVK